MFPGERFVYNDGGRLINEFADGRVRIYMHETGMRYTEIDLAGHTITVARHAIPGYIPDEYGRISVRGDELAIKRFDELFPQYIIKDGPKLMGHAGGNRLDLTLAYSLGVSDAELVEDLHGSKIDGRITDRIATIVFQS